MLGEADRLAGPSSIRSAVHEVVQTMPVTDMHTHLFAPAFGAMNLWGVDELLGYHYLVAEVFRVSPMRTEVFWSLTPAQRADLIWDELFVKRTPLSEATQGVVRVLSALGLDASAADLREARSFFAEQDPSVYAERVLDMAGVEWLVMTNDPLDPEEAAVWKSGLTRHPRYRAALRLDRMLVTWPDACGALQAQGYAVTEDATDRTFHEARRFLADWITLMQPLYMAVSLPSDFQFPDDSVRTRLLRNVVLPTCLERRLPLALMIGVRRQVNPSLRLAGDGVGRADVSAAERLASEYPEVRFLITMLSRENQHELCVAARKFGNLLPFGCWWFLNNPSIVKEITQERLEMLGTSFIAQHSDARVLDQLLYKWAMSRRVIADALTEAFCSLEEAGRTVTSAAIEADVRRLLSTNFRSWVEPS